MIKKYRPVTPGTRHRKVIVHKEVTVSKPHKALIESSKGTVGRNHGRISSRHREQGHKKAYRIIDFKRGKHDIVASVATIEYDPNRGPNIALLHYADGEKSYILAPEGIKVGSKLVSGEKVEVAVGNALPLQNIPLGVLVHNIEINPGHGGQMARGAGNSALIMAKEGNYVSLKLPSGEVKKVHGRCYATIGVLGNMDARLVVLGKAGINRHLGNRPHVRGVAMANPAKHPHAGSYNDKGVGMKFPKSPWGWNTRGKKTRSRSHTNKFLVKDRRKK